MTTPPRTPAKTLPRFVPTLTEVVQLPAQPLATELAQPGPPHLQAVIEPAAQAAPFAAPLGPTASPPYAPDLALAGSLPCDLDEALVQRVMQRLGHVLEQRLCDAIALVVQEQTRAMLPRLRQETESAVRHAVTATLADELASRRRQP